MLPVMHRPCRILEKQAAYAQPKMIPRGFLLHSPGVVWDWAKRAWLTASPGAYLVQLDSGARCALVAAGVYLNPVFLHARLLLATTQNPARRPSAVVWIRAKAWW